MNNFKIEKKDLRKFLRQAQGVETADQWLQGWDEVQEEFMNNLEYEDTTEVRKERWEDPGGDPPFAPSYDYWEVDGTVNFTSWISLDLFANKCYKIDIDDYKPGDENQLIDYLRSVFNENIYTFKNISHGKNEIGKWITSLGKEGIKSITWNKLDFSIQGNKILITGEFQFEAE